MGLMFPDDPRHGPPRRASRKISLLFQETPEDRCFWRQRHGIEPASARILNDFQMLQSIWHREEPIYPGCEERRAWTQLIEHLTQLPPPRG
jgi:hypothetical protein